MYLSTFHILSLLKEKIQWFTTFGMYSKRLLNVFSHRSRTKHFFTGLLVREVRAGLLQKQRIREQSISTLRSLLQAHDTDPRYFNPIAKQRIAGLYFPFVITTLEFHQVVNDYLGFEEKVNWLLCFFYIIENCNRELLREWWDRSSSVKHLKLFLMMEMATEVFKGQQLSKPMSFIMMDMILDFVVHFKDTLVSPNNEVLAKIFDVLQKLQVNQSLEFMRGYYHLINVITKLFSKSIFWYVHCVVWVCTNQFSAIQIRITVPVWRTKSFAIVIRVSSW